MTKFSPTVTINIPFVSYTQLFKQLTHLQIVLDGCQLLKLSDFSLAKSTDDCHNHYDFKSTVHTLLSPESASSLPSLKSIYAPSPYYAAPELFEQADFSPATDLWSLGCVVYELCLGEWTHVYGCV